jgi:exopolysaccharide biosynthesis polyprenyl glycosylphosphotransferase
MLDDRASAANTASQHINRVSTSKIDRPRVAWASRWGVVAVLQVVEVATVAATSYFCLAAILANAGGGPTTVELLASGVAVAMLVHSGLRSAGSYEFVDLLRMWPSSKNAAVAWILCSGPLLLVALLFTPTATCGQTVVIGWLAGLAGIVFFRLGAALAGNALLRARWLGHNVVIVGTGLEAQRCANLLRVSGGGAHVVGLVSVDCTNRDEGGNAFQLSDLQRLINTYSVQDVIACTQFREQATLPDLVKSLRWLPVRVFLWLPSLGIHAGLLAGDGRRIGDIPLLLAGVPPLDGWRWVIKDVRDRVLALLLLVFMSPVLLGIVLMILMTSPGPILFKQQREGYGGSMFTIFKFRTMRPSTGLTSKLVLTARDDPRVFPFGALLRKTSLDELPQLINVLRGDMWLVGPRPHSPLATAAGQRYTTAVFGYMARLRVKPGITGWAQVNGWRGPTNTLEQIQQRFTYDLYYIQHLSLWLDLRVLLQTAIRGFVHRNAY